MKNNFVFPFIIAIPLVLISSQLSGQPPPPKEVIVEGMVYHARTGRGISGLTVQLTPPQSAKSPKRVLQTDQNGNFRFQDNNANKYLGKNLLEVREGMRLLFWKEIDTSRPEFRRVRIPINR